MYCSFIILHINQSAKQPSRVVAETKHRAQHKNIVDSTRCKSSALEHLHARNLPPQIGLPTYMLAPLLKFYMVDSILSSEMI